MRAVPADDRTTPRSTSSVRAPTIRTLGQPSTLASSSTLVGRPTTARTPRRWLASVPIPCSCSRTTAVASAVGSRTGCDRLHPEGRARRLSPYLYSLRFVECGIELAGESHTVSAIDRPELEDSESIRAKRSPQGIAERSDVRATGGQPPESAVTAPRRLPPGRGSGTGRARARRPTAGRRSSGPPALDRASLDAPTRTVGSAREWPIGHPPRPRSDRLPGRRCR